MLSISKPFKGAGRANYYLNLAREDYYLNDHEPPGHWLGEGAALFGLPELVAGDDFRNLLAGYDIERAKALVHNAGSPKRRSGWDLTWSVPKSVSVAWSQATPAVRAIIEAEVWRSVRRAIHYLETIGVVSRRGTDGVVHESARLTFAGFLHSTSRAQDPQLHIHTILINLGIRPDGSTGTLDPRAIFRHQLAAGALFRAELAFRLERSLGLRARRERRCFEIIGVDSDLITEFSKRRAQIEQWLRELGLNGPKAAEIVAFETRDTKKMLPRPTLFAQWHEVGRAYRWSTKELGWLLHAPFPLRNVANEIAQCSDAALQALTQNDSHFSARQLVQALAEEAQGRGINADTVVALQQELLTSTQVVSLRPRFGESRWTTPEMLALEKHALQTADNLHHGERNLPEARSLVNQVLPNHAHLSVEQRVALRHVTGHEGGIRVVTGMAGTGKSSLFCAAKEVWTAQERQVYGACLAGKAAQELTQTSGVASQTLHRMLLDIDRGRLRLDVKSILLIDEAGMVGTRQMAEILNHSLRSGASLVLCGDAGQLQSIEAGGVFRELSERFGSAALQKIRRQRELWAREAVRAFADGRTVEALSAYSGRGLLLLSDDANITMGRLLRDWKAEALETPRQAIILASRNTDATALNELAQRARYRAGELHGKPFQVGAGLFFVGDRIIFTRNCPQLQVFNGQMATLADARANAIAAELDCGRTLLFSPARYPHLQLAYALNTHKAQGLTVERAFVYLDPTTQSRETAYVQASRARGLCSFYAVAESLDELVPSMTRSRPKVMATSLLKQFAPTLTLELAC